MLKYWEKYLKIQKIPKIFCNIKIIIIFRGVFGIAGLTAYFGFFDIGKPKAGDTVVVSAAAGSVGELVV